MRVEQVQFLGETGWTARLPSDLDGPSTLVLVFGQSAIGRTVGDGGPLDAVHQAFPASVVVGCSSAGDVAHGQIVDEPLNAVVARFDHAHLASTTTEIDGVHDSAEAGERLARALPPAGLRAVLVLSTGVGVNGAALVAGLQRSLPDGVPVSGVLAGDGSRFERTWVVAGGRAYDHGATAVGFYGDELVVGHGCESGWQDFGPERVITRAEGNVLYELDHKPALTLYKDYLGTLADQLPGSALLFPLSIRGDDGPPVIRTILGIDEAEHSMTFAGEMPLGATARLMRTNIDRLAMSAESAARDALDDVGERARSAGAPILALSVSCVGRRLVMGERTEEEVEAVSLGLPPGSVHAGFYSYGEIAPQLGFCSGALHNQTMTVTVLAELPTET